MPIQRFKDFESAQEDLWLEPGDPQCVKKWAALLALTRRFTKTPIVRGIQKFHSLAEAQIQQESST